MAHLEDLIAEHLDWQGYVVKQNVMVGKRAKGGWDMELDVIAYRHETHSLLHLEPSLDAHTWAKREERFTKKFEAGRRHIFEDIFSWLDSSTPIEQIAILPSRGTRETLAGAALITVDEYVAKIRKDIAGLNVAAKGAVPEKYPLLRTIQFLVNGYHRVSPD